MDKILVVEDDSKLRANICELLESENYLVEYAENGAIGLEKAQKHFPDLIISDIMMPELNGFELLEELMKNRDTASIPLIFLSAKAEPEHLRKGMTLGADDYLYKPFRILDLLDAVETRLKKKEIINVKLRYIQEQVSRKIPHELRTPLVPILGLSEMISEEEDITEIKEMVKVISSNAKKLHQKIEKFILYNDLVVGEGKNKNANNDSNCFFSEEIIFQCLTEIEEKLKPIERVKISIEPANIKFNEYNLSTIIKELIENGLKFSAEGTYVKVEGTIEQEKYNLKITDFGRGIAKKDLNSINAFEKFGKQQFSEPGFGLGLTIVKKIINSQNCKFEITSEIEKKTICEVEIPLNK